MERKKSNTLRHWIASQSSFRRPASPYHVVWLRTASKL
jgi:hypothetical protein